MRVPVVRQHVDGAFGAIHFDPRHVIALDGEAGGDNGKALVAEIHQNLEIVVGLHRHLFVVHDTLGDGDAGHRHHPLGGAQKPGQCGDVVNSKVKHRPAARFIKERVPVRAGPAIKPPRRQRAADVARLNVAPHVLIGRRQGDMGGADQMAFGHAGQRHQFGRLGQIHRHRLFDQHMLARIQRVAGQLAVALHRGQDQHHIDIGVRQNLAVVGGEIGYAPGAGAFGLAGAQVATDDNLAGRALQIQPPDMGHIFLGHRTQTDHADTHRFYHLDPSSRPRSSLGFQGSCSQMAIPQIVPLVMRGAGRPYTRRTTRARS